MAEKSRIAGEGSLFVRMIHGKKYFTLSKWIGRNSRIRVTVYGKSEREVVQKMREKEQEHLEQECMTTSGSDPSTNIVLLEDAVETWLTTYKKPEMKPKSFDTLYSTYKTYCKGNKIGKITIRNVRADDIQKLLNDVGRKQSFSTTKKVFLLYSAFFKHYFAQMPMASPMLLVKPPVSGKGSLEIRDDGSIDDGEIVVLSDEDMELLSIELGKERFSSCYMLLFLMWSFMRLGECQAIQYKDIDFEKGTVRINKAFSRVRKDEKDIRKGETKWEWKLFRPKTRNANRVVRLCPEAMEALQNHLRLLRNRLQKDSKSPVEIDPNAFIFHTGQGNPFASQNLVIYLNKALKRCGVSKYLTVHGLRHTGISYFIRHGYDIKVISQQAGHADISVTTKIYYNIVQEQVDNLYADRA